MINFLQLGIDSAREPSEPEGHMDDVHSQITHHADGPAGADLTLPVRRLGRIKIAGMPEAGADF